MIGRMIQAVSLAAAAAMIGILLYWQVDLVHRGGPVMIPIMMCSLFSLALIVDRLVYFVRLHLGKDTAWYFEELRAALEQRRWEEAEQLCHTWRGPVARVALAGLASREATAQEIDEAMEEAAHEELPAVERHLRWLSTLAQISTLLGLLGTVTGLVRAFQVIEHRSASGAPVSPGDLAGGVWEALITTVAGLSVAIPTILAYNYLAGRVGEVQFQMEKAAALMAGWRRLGAQAPPRAPAGSRA